MKYFIIILLILNLVYCESDPNRDKKRNTNKMKIAALIGHHSESKSVVEVDEETYAKYDISAKYGSGYVHFKYTEKGKFYFVISTISRDKVQ